MTEVVVIGAGPAGLSAAQQACAAGAAVVLVDAADGVGGQFWRHLPADRPARREHVLHHQWSRYQSLRDDLVRNPRCRILASAQVWAIERSETTRGRSRLAIHLLVGPADGPGRTGLTLMPDALILATGAHDRVLPFPGWDLPGVFSAGAAQALAKGERVAVGSRVIVAGAGPFLLPVASSLTQTGATVIGVHEASGPGALVRGWGAKPWQLGGSVAKVGELAGYARHHVQHRIPYRTGSAVVAVHGTDSVEAVTVARVDAQWRLIAGTEQRIVVDAVCVSHGFTPRLELPIAAGCRLDDQRFVQVDERQLTSVPHVYAAGEITGIGGMPLAAAEGVVAGRAAAGSVVSSAMLRRRQRHQRFAARIDAAHGIQPGWIAWLHGDTTICRCEEVSYGRLRQAADETGSRGLRSLKLSTRAGLGICQARMCGRTVEEILCGPDPTGGLLGTTTTDRRPIASPVRLAELAADPQQLDSTAHASMKGTP